MRKAFLLVFLMFVAMAAVGQTRETLVVLDSPTADSVPEFVTAFALDRECHGIDLIIATKLCSSGTCKAPAVPKFWIANLFDSSFESYGGEGTFWWDVTQRKHGRGDFILAGEEIAAFSDGSSNARTAARQVCRIIHGRGGHVEK